MLQWLGTSSEVLGRLRIRDRLKKGSLCTNGRSSRFFDRFINLSGALLGAHVAHAGMSGEAGAVNRLEQRHYFGIMDLLSI